MYFCPIKTAMWLDLQLTVYLLSYGTSKFRCERQGRLTYWIQAVPDAAL